MPGSEFWLSKCVHDEAILALSVARDEVVFLSKWQPVQYHCNRKRRNGGLIDLRGCHAPYVAFGYYSLGSSFLCLSQRLRLLSSKTTRYSCTANIRHSFPYHGR